METILHIWNIFVTSNTFNFIVMLFILSFIVKKLNVSQNLENLKNEIITSIHNAEEEKKQAQEELFKTKKSLENLDTEIANRLESAKDNAKNMAKNVLNDTEKHIRQIEENVLKTIEREEKAANARLTNQAAKNSIDLSTQKIIELLKTNPQLHEKFIEESIQRI